MSDYKEDVKKFLEEMQQNQEKENIKPGDVRKNVPEEIEDEDVKNATEKAFEELEEIRQAFLEFQHRIKELELYEDIKPNIGMTADGLEAMHELMRNDVDETQLSPEVKKEYIRAQKVRAKILARIYNKYYKE